jgi:hypothetical protein
LSAWQVAPNVSLISPKLITSQSSLFNNNIPFKVAANFDWYRAKPRREFVRV